MLQQAVVECVVEQSGSGLKEAQHTAARSDGEGAGEDGSSTTLLKSKKELRRERKKRKLLGLSALMMLNEQDSIGSSRNKVTVQNSGKQETPSDQQNLENGTGVVPSVNGGDKQLKQILAKNHTAYVIGAEEEEKEVSTTKRRREEENDNASGTEAVKCKPLATSSGVDKAAGSINSDAEYRALKAYVNQKKSMRFVPRVLLKPIGQSALLDRSGKDEERIPLLLDDLQDLLMHTFLRTDSPLAPRWISIEKNTKLTHTTVLIVEGFSCEDFVTYREHMPNCSVSIFGPQHTLQVVCPWTHILEEVACVPLSDTHKDVLVAEYGSLEAAMLMCKDQMLVRKSVFRNIGPIVRPVANYSKVDLPPTDKFPRTLLLLSPIQMINEGYPVPLAGTLENKYKSYVTTSDEYKPVNPRSPMYGIDCEMCGTYGNKSVLTRVSMVDEQRKLVYDKLVKPATKITDYRTKFSGITPKMMVGVQTTLADVQRELREILPPDAILVGHSLNSDLLAMELLHPYVIDTSIIYNVTGNPMHKQKLKVLTKKFLDQEIQCGTGGHDSYEDCAASLQLVQLKLANDIYFGDQYLEDRRKYHSFRSGTAHHNGIAQLDISEELAPAATSSQQTPQIMATLFSHAKKRNKRSVIVTNANEELRTFKQYFGNTIAKRGEATNASQQWLSCHKTSSPGETINNTASNCLQYDFNLAYVRLKGEENGTTNGGQPVEASTDKTKLAQQIDGWVGQLHDALSLNGLFVVLLVGAKEPQSRRNNRIGVAMVQTKKSPTIGSAKGV
uniref:Exonuclease domain-containing protein n=1 Tax=Anopheles epiroticus TaxID=199890 RepID=A0A182PL88_9DIPT